MVSLPENKDWVRTFNKFCLQCWALYSAKRPLEPPKGPQGWWLSFHTKSRAGHCSTSRCLMNELHLILLTIPWGGLCFNTHFTDEKVRHREFKWFALRYPSSKVTELSSWATWLHASSMVLIIPQPPGYPLKFESETEQGRRVPGSSKVVSSSNPSVSNGKSEAQGDQGGKNIHTQYLIVKKALLHSCPYLVVTADTIFISIIIVISISGLYTQKN